MSAFALRTATAADADAIATLHTANWRSAYAAILDPAYLAGPVIEDRHAVWRERLTSPAPDMEVVVAENDQGIVGFVSLFHEREPAWGGFVDNLHTAAAVRGQGAGKALLVEAARRTAARDPAKGLYLWVFERNESAVGFYLALGATIAQRLVSDWDKAPDEIRFRMHWPKAADLARN